MFILSLEVSSRDGTLLRFHLSPLVDPLQRFMEGGCRKWPPSSRVPATHCCPCVKKQVDGCCPSPQAA